MKTGMEERMALLYPLYPDRLVLRGLTQLTLSKQHRKTMLFPQCKFCL